METRRQRAFPLKVKCQKISQFLVLRSINKKVRVEGERLGQEERGEEASWHNLGNYNFVTAWRGTGQNIELI